MVKTTQSVLVETSAGWLKGYTSQDVCVFLGIRYAEAARFQMPRPVKPWTGVKAAYGYGFRCPTPIGPSPAGDETMMPLRFWPDNENCQFLNVWTCHADPEHRRPVMVWLHGGGYAAGSAMEHMYYDGLSLCRENDIVLVSINHRLNILGYLDLSPFSEKYYNSGNVGNADIVAALQWVHDNIAAFGGDPGNVTIFGQSGGGCKVRDLMQIPAADGLYHRAIIQSGIIPAMENVPKSHNGRAIVTALMDAFGLSSAEQLEKVPYQELVRQHTRLAPALMERGEYIGGSPLPNDWYPGDCYAAGYNEYSLKVPTLVGTAFAEFSYTLAPEGKYEMSPAEQTAFLRGYYGDSTEEVIRLFSAAYPDKNLCDAAIVDRFMRIPSLNFALKKAAVSEAPVYTYLYTYETAMEHTAAWHLGEIPFVFRNSHLVPRLLEEGVSDVLEDKMANAWAAFAESGNPGHRDLPEWRPCTAEDDYTMIFDRQVRVGKNFDREMLDYLGEHFPQPLYHAAVGTIHADALSDEEKAAREAEMKVMVKDTEEG